IVVGEWDNHWMKGVVLDGLVGASKEWLEYMNGNGVIEEKMECVGVWWVWIEEIVKFLVRILM
ncbi:hypothetical protein, partial [Bacillus pumilus]|uniref:hypothetical protein n=1 Tax=Bacillus pumilus TaxID=1408 RepID=UPI0016426E55